jgi:hypothetical protein
MKHTRKCFACKELFATDYRDDRRQVYCTKDDCQRARRRLEQIRRRAASRAREGLAQALEGRMRLQSASALREAFFEAQSPVLIGLISTLTDSRSREELEKTLWRLWERGQSLLQQMDPVALKNHRKTV